MRSVSEAGAPRGDWRADAFRQVSQLLLIAGVPAALAALLFGAPADPLAFRLEMSAVIVAFVFVGVRSADPRRWRALAAWLVGTVVAACLVGATQYGVTPVVAMALLASLALGRVFLGRRTVLWATAAIAALLVAMGGATRAGLLHPVDLRWSRMQTWVELAATFFVGTTAAASILASLIGRLERGLVDEREARAAAEGARRRSELLAEASRILASSLDYESTVRRVAEPSVPLLGDYCVVDVLGKDDAVRRFVAGPAGDGARAALLRRLEAFTPKPDGERGISKVMRTRRTVVAEHVTEDMLRPGSAEPPLAIDDPEFLRLVRELGLRSYVSVPLVARGQMLGALTFVKQRDETQDPADVATAEELGRRAAAAVDNGRLFEASQQAVVMREEFLAAAAHELRTPITSLLLALQAIARQTRKGAVGAASGLAARMVHIAEQQATGLNRLVDTLLATSRLSTGSLPISLTAVDLTEAVGTAVAQLSEPLRASGSTLTLEASGPIVGWWDGSRLHQVVIHLLSNAMKYGEGRPIEVGVHASDDSAQLVVRDHGMGIAPELQDRIFGRFERAVPAEHYGGLGLGLYVVQRIVAQLGGAVECTSAPAKGATFVVTLPRRRAS